MTTLLLALVLIGIVANLGMLLFLLRRRPDAAIAGFRERLEESLREEQRSGRAELRQQLDSLAGRSDERLDRLRETLAEDARKARSEGADLQQRFTESLGQRLKELTDRNEQRLAEMRGTLEQKLRELQADNAAKLEQMRATVDEKLQGTLNARLDSSFTMISERLEAVQRGLGEMQVLATGVGDLKRLLENVKTRGTFGEVQLASLLEQVLVAEQYEANVATVPGSNARVEFAIKLPGAEEGGQVWLPIDAKFPREDYERLLDAQECADADAAAKAGIALERRLRDEAKQIREKYVASPHTTEFAILFLPTEGLYAEAIRRPGLFETLQREHRVTITGPTTLLAVLNSLQMGFRTLAIQRRSGEVWQLLGAVKSEFGKFAGILEKAEKQINTVGKSIGEASRKTRTIERRLRNVETLDAGAATQIAFGAAALLGEDAEDETDDVSAGTD
ncbi:MAG: DNA recombination protein RmuC [Lysobacteraceae bacterium]|nr:MAG: DNA recombination protein RmuC [Xanthomonadaceae bacterium]